MTVRVLVLAALGLLAAGRPAPAQTTYTWDGGAGNGNWSSAANWVGDVVPVSGPATTILLNGTVQTVTNQNLANPFVLNRLNLGPAATTPTGFTVNGGPIQFAGTGASINTDVDATGAAQGSPSVTSPNFYQLRVNTAVNFGVSTGVNFGTNNAPGAEVVLAGPLTAAAGVTLALANVGGLVGGGTLVIASSNNTGLNNLTVTGATTIVQLAGANALSRQTVVNLSSLGTLVVGSTAAGAGPAFPTQGVSQQLGQVTGATQVDFVTAASTATLAVGFDNASTTLSGPFSNTGASSQLAKVGTGTLTYTGVGASGGGFASGLSVRDGSFVLSGGGRLASTTATVGGTQVLGRATLTVNNGLTAIQDRLQDTGTVTLAGGSLLLFGNAATNVSEQVGGVRLLSGESAVAIGEGATGTDISAGRAHRLLAADLAQSTPTATLLLRATNLGGGNLETGSAVGGITFATAPTALLVGGGGAGGTPATSILPFVTGAGTAGGLATGFVTYVGSDSTGASRTRLLAAAEYAPAFGTATDNVAVAGTATVAAATTVNAVLSGGGIVLNGELVITSGAFLSTGSSSVTGGSALRFGPGGTGTAFVTSTAGNLVFAAPAAAARLAKSGPGTLTVQAPVALGASPTVAVNTGTLAVLNNGGATTGGFTPASGGVTFQVARGATLDYTGVTGGLALSTGAVLQGGGGLTGPLTVGTGATVAPSGLGGAAPALASPGTLTTDGVRLQGGGTYRWHVSSVLPGLYTQSAISSAGVLDLTDPTLTAATPFVVRPVSLTLQNAPGALYDFDPAQPYTFPLGTFAGGVNGFAADKFTVNAAEFVNPVGGTFAVAQSGNTLNLVFTPVPEPGLLLVVAAAGLAGGRRLRRSAAV